jgi:hypothetical protein
LDQQKDRSRAPARLARLVRTDGWINAAARLTSTAIDRSIRPLDRRLGTFTAGHLELGKRTDKDRVRYVPIVASAFEGMLRDVAPEPKGTFVDLGAGRGRCVLIALEHGFRQAVGVEHSAELCTSARQNLLASGLEGGEIWESDAAVVELPQDTTVISMYNPFPADVWRRVLNGPISELPGPVTVVTHAMPHARLVGETAVKMHHSRTVWARGRDFEVLRVTPT